MASIVAWKFVLQIDVTVSGRPLIGLFHWKQRLTLYRREFAAVPMPLDIFHTKLQRFALPFNVIVDYSTKRTSRACEHPRSSRAAPGRYL